MSVGRHDYTAHTNGTNQPTQATQPTSDEVKPLEQYKVLVAMLVSSSIVKSSFHAVEAG